MHSLLTRLYHYLITPSFAKRVMFFIGSDLFLFYVSLHFAYALRFDFSVPSEFNLQFYRTFWVLALIKIVIFYLLGIYRLTWRYFGLEDVKRLLFACISAFGIFFAFFAIMPEFFLPMPRSAIGIDLLLSFLLVGGVRASKRIVIEQSSKPFDRKPALIIGVSEYTANLVRSTLDPSVEYYPLAIVALQEKNHHLIGSTIQNLTIIDPHNLMATLHRHGIRAAIIDGNLPGESFQQAYRLASDAGITDIKRSVLLSEGRESIASLSVEDLLARNPKDLDAKTVQKFMSGKTVLVTGAGGSIGSEIALQCRRFGANRLILLDNSEYNLYQIGEKLPGAELHLCSILNVDAFESILQNTSVDLIVHAAAYKHVPLCESNPVAAIENNIQGSRNVIDGAIRHHVPKLVIISSDKAVRPTNVMGATKRVVELYAQNVAPKDTEIVSVRFGNVLGSSGSVIPKFKSQIEAGGPITITHPDITRYFMLVGEACQLVLQAAAIARGGELFILDMGEPVRIVDLAQTMIRLYADRPIEIVYTGLRPGEKLYEELLIDETEQKTAYDSILIARPTPYDITLLDRQIDRLLQDTSERIELLHTIVPEFVRNGQDPM